ncbi:hypothetical protein VQ045_15055 [Aurantimonas sp. E1-2-R+4]|uniref:hypothetical protein n=1 Tax=Aurantimonas sp. E1-2-R+4 TaxID=3113714 RepID=UPI002F93CC36
MSILYALGHLGYTIPPRADCGWIGEAGPAPSYGDHGAGLDNDFTRRNITIMTWNLLHMARMLKAAGGPAEPRQRSPRLGGRLPLRLREPGAPGLSREGPLRAAPRRRQTL